MPPKISIVIPTYHREVQLKILLDSILEQTILPSNFEVIVVDNYPTPYQPTHDLCASSRYALLKLTCVNHPVLGSSEARNFGQSQVRAPWIGFIDDDEKLPAHWVERAFEIIDIFRPDIFGGPNHPYNLDQKPLWLKDEYLTLSMSLPKGWVDCDSCLFGGNIVFKRSWFERLQGYSTKLGRIGKNKEYGENDEIELRAHRQGARFYYDPDLYVFHYVSPEQLKATWFLSSAWYHGKADAKISVADQASSDQPILDTLARLGSLILCAFKVAGQYLALPFRDRRAAPFSENYLVQTIAPTVSEFALSWYLLVFNFRRRR
jgi:glucosyl-dolichyl phosphate glucuronosyltransferase